MSNSKRKVAETVYNNKVGKQEVSDQRYWPALKFHASGLEALGDGAEAEQIATENQTKTKMKQYFSCLAEMA